MTSGTQAPIVIHFGWPHTHLYRDGRGVADPPILTYIVVAAEWPIPAFSLLLWWPRRGRSPHSHFYRGGRGVADPRILTSIVAEATSVFDLEK